MVHAILPKPIPHPTWDMLLDHVGANPNPGGVELRSWIHDLVLRPTRPQRALLLTGPETNGKTVFHDAMGLLLPPGGIVQFPGDGSVDLEALLPGRQRVKEVHLDDAWLAVLNDVPGLYAQLFEKPRYHQGRFLKWSLTHPRAIERPMPNVIRFDVRPPALVIPDIIRLLEDERDAFERTLQRYAT